MSRIGRLPVAVPNGVEVKIGADVVEVKGPKGSLSTPVCSLLTYEQADGHVILSRIEDDRVTRAQHGLRRTLLSNCIDGVTKGFSKALEVIENYFWQFCDDYIELVKNRAYGTADSTGNVPSEAAVKSARTTLGLGLDAFARLLAPYLPYATEEVWSWMHEGEGSVHRAAWPVADVYAAAAGDASADLLAHAGEALAALRGIKSKAKVSMKTPILSVTLAVADDVRGSIEAALGDIAEAGRVTGPIAFTAPAAAEGEDEAADVTVAESELGEPPAKKPKK